MRNKLLKYLLITVLLWGTIFFCDYLLRSGFFNNMFSQRKITVLIEAGFDVKNNWSYRAEKGYRTIKSANINSEIIMFYFNQTIESVPKNIKGEYDFLQVTPYGDTDYTLIEKFIAEKGFKPDYLLVSENIEVYKVFSKKVVKF